LWGLAPPEVGLHHLVQQLELQLQQEEMAPPTSRDYDWIAVHSLAKNPLSGRLLRVLLQPLVVRLRFSSWLH